MREWAKVCDFTKLWIEFKRNSFILLIFMDSLGKKVYMKANHSDTRKLLLSYSLTFFLSIDFFSTAQTP